MPSPGEDIQAWSITASNNANSDPLINWAEGQPRASVNNSARSMLASHAKDRNLKNGSITTGGSANAQTFTSGVGYTGAVPTGLRVLLKAGFTNTGATTLNMDGIGDVAIKGQDGNDIGSGSIVIGQYIELLYNGTIWILLRQSGGGASPQSGRLSLVSATQLAFTPYNGDQIRINGVNYSIPTAGIAGLGNTGVFVSGVAGQNLAVSSVYNIYAFNNAGTITADFNANAHVTSTTAGNIGTEILTGDDSRTLIGKVATSDVGAQFSDDIARRYTLTWFNRRALSLVGPYLGATATASTTPVELALPGTRALFLTWLDECLTMAFSSYALNNTPSGLCFATVLLDGVGVSTLANSDSGGNSYMAMTPVFAGNLTESYHSIACGGSVNTGTGTFYGQMIGSIRG